MVAAILQCFATGQQMARAGRGRRCRVSPIVVVLFVLVALTGCAIHGLSFTQDDRVEIVSPRSSETVRLPFEVRWTSEGFDGRFAVFFDGAPMRPGHSLLSLVPDRDPCRAEPDCPDEAWLADRGIYVTAGHSLTVERLTALREASGSKDHHELTVVLLDAAGQRVGESTFMTEFTVEREDG